VKISVIVPTLNEEGLIADCLSDLVKNHAPDELIVADGGSVDRTLEIASRFARVLKTQRGRALQMNKGAKEAKGDGFLFLHADTKLPPKGLEMVRCLITKKMCQAGRFRMRFDQEDFLLRLYSYHTRFHCFSYGDQAFFLTRNIFEEMEGFSERVPFEDIDFYKRLRKLTRPLIIKSPVTTSARRFLKVGKLHQKWINLALVSLYYLGVDVLPFKEKVYQDVR